MPLFHRHSEDEKQHEAEMMAEQQASISALQAGSIPVAARRRLEEAREQKRPFFTSDLTVAEFALARQAGVQPISQVMGSSVYHIGWQYMQSWGGSGELQTISQAYNHARQLALGRMTQEAALSGANAVIGVHILSGRLGEGKMIEFQAIGTAVRVTGVAPGATPGLTNLSGQDFWALLQAGYWPVGVAAGTTAYHVVPTWGTQWAMGGMGGWYNQELTDFTQGLYTARAIAMARVSSEAREHGASGIVGVVIEQEQEEYEVNQGNNSSRTDMIFTFHVIGTAVIERDVSRRPLVQPVLKLNR